MTLYDCSVPSSDGCFLQDNAPCHKPHIISDWFYWTWQRGHSNLMASIKSPDFKTKEHPWNEVEPANLHQLWCCHCNMDQNSWGTFSAPFWICATNKAKGGVLKEVAGDYTSIKKTKLFNSCTLRWDLTVFHFEKNLKTVVSVELCSVKLTHHWTKHIQNRSKEKKNMFIFTAANEASIQI